ncbi:MAG: hypothetical protein AB7O56_12465 [Bauldia sp.]
MKFPTPGSSIGLFAMFGRSSDLRQLDEAFRSVDVHPRMIPEAVKLTIAKLLKEDSDGAPTPDQYRRAAEIVGYCTIGPNGFAGANGEELMNRVEQRIEIALGAETSLDAQLILLTLHAKLIQPSVVDMFDLESSG